MPQMSHTRLSEASGLPEGRQRVPGEVSTWKAPNSSGMESEYGECPFGGCHMWRFGKCRKCDAAEGQHMAEHYAQMRLNSEVTFRQPPREDPTPRVPSEWPEHRSAKRETSHGTVNSLLARIEREGEPTRPRNSVTRDASTESLGQLSSRYVARVHRTTPPLHASSSAGARQWEHGLRPEGGMEGSSSVGEGQGRFA